MRLANQHYYIIGGFYCKLKRLLSTCIAGGFFKDYLTKTDRASLLDARSVLYDNPLLLLIPLVSFLKLYKTPHELSIVLSFFVVFSKIIKVLSSPATLRTNSPTSMPHWPGWWRAAPWLLCRSGTADIFDKALLLCYR